MSSHQGQEELGRSDEVQADQALVFMQGEYDCTFQLFFENGDKKVCYFYPQIDFRPLYIFVHLEKLLLFVCDRISTFFNLLLDL